MADCKILIIDDDDDVEILAAAFTQCGCRWRTLCLFCYEDIHVLARGRARLPA